MGKYISQQALQSYPSMSPSQVIAKIQSSQGGNLFKVEADGVDLVSLPTKFLKSLWIRRGSFVIVEPCDNDSKVNGVIVRVLMAMDIKELKREKKWPLEFLEVEDSETETDESKMILPEIITDAIISYLDLKSVLILHQTLITQNAFHAVALEALKVLVMIGIQDENTDFNTFLIKSNVLQELRMHQSINYQNDIVLRILANHSRLVILEIDQAYDITNIGLNSVLSECKALKELSIMNCPSLDKDVFINIANLNLNTLNVSKCRLVCNDFIRFISMKCLELRDLDISNDSLVSRIDYLSDLPLLSSFVVSGCYLLSDQSFANFKSRHLNELDISFCTSITDVGLSIVQENCPILTSVNLREASGISLNGIDAACKSRKGQFYGSILEFK